MKHVFRRLLMTLALAGLAFTTSASAAHKPLVIESGKVKQLPAATTLQVNASGTGAASINIPHGTAPTAPNNGDCWTTTTGLFCRVNGATVGPYSNASAITAKDEGSSLTTATTSVDFVGSGVTATNTGGAVTITIPGGAAGTVTATGTPASGNLTKFSGAASVTNADLSGDVTTSGALATTITNDAVSYAKIQNVSAASKLIGRGDSGSGDPQEITLGTGLTMTGTTLSSSGGGGGSITAKDEGSNLTTALTSIDFVGAGVTATNSSGDVTVTIPGGVVLLGTYTASGSTAVADFTSIPATYKDLIIVATGRTAAASSFDSLNLTVNGLTTSIYDKQRIFNATTTTIQVDSTLAQSGLQFFITSDTAAANQAGVTHIEIFDYAGTTFNKNVVGYSNADLNTTFSKYLIQISGSIRLTSAINRVTLTTPSNFKSGTKVYLYGRT
jgi:hypothetical protein